MLIDLHAHSTASDGTDKPADLMSHAAAAGLDVVAITDHDTTAGWEAALDARPDRLTVIRGAEFSTVAHVGARPVSVHVLGYLFDPAAPAVVAEHRRLRTERLNRGMAIVAKMVDAGLPITAEQVMTIADGAPIGRPHVGQALVASGVVGSVDEAFASFLAGNGRFFVRKADTDLPTAVRMITAAGGVSIIAHPRGRGEYRALTAEYIEMLAAQGLGGLEVDHPDHTQRDRDELRSVARGLDLLITGSSDYHGTNKALRLGQETTGEATLAALVARTTGVTAPVGPATIGV